MIAQLLHCLFAPDIQYMDVIFRAHPVRGESCIQWNANRQVATLLYVFFQVP